MLSTIYVGLVVVLFGPLIWLPNVINASHHAAHGFDMNNYFRMPPLYQLDDYDRCFKENPPKDEKIVYCYARAQIRPNDTIEVWPLIQNFSADHKRHFRHDRLVRGVCLHWCKPHFKNYVPSAKRRYFEAHFDNASEITYDAHSIEGGMDDRIKYDKWINRCVNWELKHKYNLKAYSQVEYCITNEKKSRYVVDDVDWAFIYVLLVLFVSIATSTAYDYYLKNHSIASTPESREKSNHYRNNVKGKYSAIVVCFSLPRNWYRLMSEPTTELGHDLRPIHALRFLTMFCVILGHSVLFMNSLPTANPQYMELNYYRVITQLLINGPTVIQTFFVITGYMLSTQFMELRANTAFNMRYLVQAIVYRYLRLTPVYMFLVLFHATWLVRLHDGPVWLHTVGPEHSFCRQNWWTNLLYANNFLVPAEPCFQHGWYLAADFQLFVVGVLVHMALWRFPCLTKPLLGVGALVALIIPACITYAQRFEGVFMATPESQRYLQWYDRQYRSVYIPAYTNAGSFLCGIIGGIVYGTAKRDRSRLVESALLRMLWWTAVPVCVAALLSGYVFYAYDLPKPSLAIAIYAAALKNVWGLYVAAIITALAFGMGWLAKDLLCHPVFRTLGRITYCAYLVHPTVIRMMQGTMREPVYWSDNLVAMYTLSAVVLSYEVALMLCLCMEFPVTYLLQHLCEKQPKSSLPKTRKPGNMLELNNFRK